jgi:8-oxo-dGTP diphosphatase
VIRLDLAAGSGAFLRPPKRRPTPTSCAAGIGPRSRHAHFTNAAHEIGDRRSPHRSAYPGLWSFPGGHVEQHETLTEALVREIREEVGVTPTSFFFLGSIDDPNAPETDPATYHMYSVSAWNGGEPTLLGDEHTALGWFTPAAAIVLPDLALEEYRPLFASMIRA